MVAGLHKRNLQPDYYYAIEWVSSVVSECVQVQRSAGIITQARVGVGRLATDVALRGVSLSHHWLDWSTDIDGWVPPVLVDIDEKNRNTCRTLKICFF
jgi:hypothetical protein